MALSDDLNEAIRMYYYLRDAKDKTVGGPYNSLSALGRGVRAAVKRGIPQDQLAPRKLVGGRFVALSADESEAMLAAYEG